MTKRTILVTAQAEVQIPEGAEVIHAANGESVGFVMGTREYRPLVGFDVQGTRSSACLITDAQMRKHGIEVVNYTDRTGVS